MNNATDEYRTIESTGEGFYKEKGSKFLAFAMPCNQKDDAKEIIDKLRKENPGACHVCFAWRFGTTTFEDRYSDDGEPNNSAGKPIFGQILSFELTNVLVAIVRYYGGTNLGVGGLVTAYKSAAKAALENAKIRLKYVPVHFSVTYDYKDTGTLMALLHKLNVEITQQGFKENNPCIHFYIRKSEEANVQSGFEPYPALELTPIETNN